MRHDISSLCFYKCSNLCDSIITQTDKQSTAMKFYRRGAQYVDRNGRLRAIERNQTLVDWRTAYARKELSEMLCLIYSH